MMYVNFAMMIVIFFVQLYELIKFARLSVKVDKFLEDQGVTNSAVLDVARATKTLAASIGSETIRSLKKGKDEIKEVVKEGIAEAVAASGPDSTILKNSPK